MTLLPLTATAGELKDAIKDAAKTAVDDATTLAKAPIKWKAPEWRRFAEGAGTVAAVMVADKKLEDIFQRNRSSATDSFARKVTPFGGGRASQVSAVLIATGWLIHNDNVFGAGRDSLEAEIWAGGIVTHQQPTISGARFTGTAYSPFIPHTVDSKAAKACSSDRGEGRMRAYTWSRPWRWAKCLSCLAPMVSRTRAPRAGSNEAAST